MYFRNISVDKFISLFEKYPIFQKGKYILRKPDKGDAEDIFNIFSDDYTMELIRAPKLTSKKEAVDFIDSLHEFFKRKERIDLVIWDEKEKKIIGLLAIHNISFIDLRVELGFILSKEYRGKGIMKYILEWIIELLFQKYNIYKVSLLVNIENESCINLCKKLDLKNEARLIGYFYNRITKEHEDVFVFTKFNKNYVDKMIK